MRDMKHEIYYNPVANPYLQIFEKHVKNILHGQDIKCVIMISVKAKTSRKWKYHKERGNSWDIHFADHMRNT